VWPTSPTASGRNRSTGSRLVATSSSSACPAAERPPRWSPSASRSPAGIRPGPATCTPSPTVPTVPAMTTGTDWAHWPHSPTSALTARTTERLVLQLADPFDRSLLGLTPPAVAGAAASIGDPVAGMLPGRGVIGRGAGVEVQVARQPVPGAAARDLASRAVTD